MPQPIGRPDYDDIRALLHNASIHFRLAFGLRATRPAVNYLDAFSWGHHVAYNDELALTQKDEEQAFAALEHCATYLSGVRVHTALESVHDDPFNIREADVASAFQISRLIRNAFAHNPFHPVWEVRDKWRNRRFVVPDVITLDTSGLDGIPVRYKHYGGPTPNAGPSKASQAFWQVEDIEREVAELIVRGVKFEKYDTPDIDEKGSQLQAALKLRGSRTQKATSWR